MNELKHCPFCGSAIESGSQFCQNCGASLTADEETPSTQPVQTTPSASTDSYQQPSVQQVPYQQQPTSVYVPQKQEDTMGVLSLIMG
ncbi:MAG: zinc ribbon domain-containing protein, partial [Candidatus Heimdallarchaeota archaeon]|nr:zinc ribbon domain-containing protein [Candidatus Heimdallarchaeota archaeon]